MTSMKARETPSGSARAQHVATRRLEMGACRRQARGGGASGAVVGAGGAKSSFDSSGAITPRATLSAPACTGIISITQTANIPHGASRPSLVRGTSDAQHGDVLPSCRSSVETSCRFSLRSPAMPRASGMSTKAAAGSGAGACVATTRCKPVPTASPTAAAAISLSVHATQVPPSAAHCTLRDTTIARRRRSGAIKRNRRGGVFMLHKIYGPRCLQPVSSAMMASRGLPDRV